MVIPSRPGSSQSVFGIIAPLVVPFQVNTTSLACGMVVRSGISP